MRVHCNPGSSGGSITSDCPLCGRPIPPQIRAHLTEIDASIIRRLRSGHPGWTKSAGACPECVHSAGDGIRLFRSQDSLHEKLLLPYPVYDPRETRLLPTPQRLSANPQYTGQGVTLAFIDSGFFPHPDLIRPQNRIQCFADATGEEVVEKDDFRQLQDSSWHGLMTSCIAAGSGYMSGRFYRGIASRAELVLVKAGNPSNRSIREVDIERAMAWVVANQRRFNIRIVNISLSGDYPPKGRLEELDQRVEEAVALGIVVVAAAGNSGVERLLPPATAPSAITVGGLDDRNTLDRRVWRMYHSNFGRSVFGHPKPELIAPAVWLAAPVLPGSPLHQDSLHIWRLSRMIEPVSRRLRQPGGRRFLPIEAPRRRLDEARRLLRRRMIETKSIHPHYQHVDGTSMAAPLVSSVVAQMLEANPSLEPAQVKEILVGTATPLPGVPIERQGAGVVDAPRAVAAARRACRGPLEGLPPTPDAQPDRVTFYYYDPSHRLAHIALVGSFNGWNPSGYALHSSSPGLWAISMPALPPGRYRYKFLLETGWTADPENPERIEDGFGGFSSILEVSA